MIHPPPTRKPAAFSLIEILVVLALVSILMALIVPAFSSLLRNGDVTRGGQILTDQANLARQTASARNRVVELRFVQVVGRAGYGAVQLWSPDRTGTLSPLRKAALLPESVTIAAQPGAINGLPTGVMPAGSSLAGQPYSALQIRPTGQITPVLAMKDLYFSVVPAVSAAQSQLTANYFILQLNPLTGAPLVYRP